MQTSCPSEKLGIKEAMQTFPDVCFYKEMKHCLYNFLHKLKILRILLKVRNDVEFEGKVFVLCEKDTVLCCL